MMSLRLLRARHGDALWLTYGKPRHHVVVDGGPRSKATTDELRRLLGGVGGRVDLVVCTHVDADHITGLLGIFEDAQTPLLPGDMWFNGWQHLPSDVLGPAQGEAFSAAINRRRLPWNTAFDGGAVVVADEGPLPRVLLPGGLTLTLLSPTRAELAALRPVWKREVEKAGLVPGVGAADPPQQPDLLGDKPLDFEMLAAAPFEGDHSQANASSIAMLAEYGGKSLLLTGDAHAEVLVPQLHRLAAERGVDRVAVDAVKVPHHGSRHNLNAELVDAVDSGRWLFSTDGSIYGHPDPATVARIVTGRPGAELVFNYRTPTTARFGSSRLRRRHRYTAAFYEDPTGAVVTL